MEIVNKYDNDEQVSARKGQDDPTVMYLIVRESLNMSLGKTGAQIGHAVGMLHLHYNNSQDIDMISIFKDWQEESFRKIVLRAKDKDWEKLKAELICVVVRDAGLTEVEPGSETVIGVWPMKKSDRPKILKRLQVLK